LTWDDIRWLCTKTKLPVVCKGVLHPEDACHAIQAGAKGLIVSNHGGRQLDGGIPALRALPTIVSQVLQNKKDGGEMVPILVDSGIRTGADCLKALVRIVCLIVVVLSRLRMIILS
jgi:isopentenyl diphosphate isomerase/L-lactate dehydrogenase-like FMN-dependent dehydrogenase